MPATPHVSHDMPSSCIFKYLPLTEFDLVELFVALKSLEPSLVLDLPTFQTSVKQTDNMKENMYQT